MIKLIYRIECEDKVTAARVQDHISLDTLLGIIGVTSVTAEWISERENVEEMGG